MTLVNPGPAFTDTPNTQALMGSSGGSGTPGQFNSTISTSPTGTVNDYSPPGYVGGLTNFIILNPAAPITLNGLSSSGVGNGFTVLIFNSSANTVTFTNLSASSLAANQFNCPQNTDGFLAQNSAATLTYNSASKTWIFT